MRGMSFGQGGYGRHEGGPGGSPDWGALAEAADADRRRRRRWAMVAGGAVATVAIAGVVAAAVVTTSGGDESPDKAADSGISGAASSSPAAADPSFSEVARPPDPVEYISSAEKDTAPISTESFFPVEKIIVSGHTYMRTATDVTEDCASGASSKLGKVLSAHDCEQLYRATYTRGEIAVTVGVAVFADSDRAVRAQEAATGNLESLPGGGVPAFCRATACRLTSNSVGRYGYFTIAGYTGDKAVTADDAPSQEAVRDTGGYVYRRIMERGREQAIADSESR